MPSAWKHTFLCVLAALYALSSSGLELLADSHLQKCPCSFRVSGYASDAAYASVLIVPMDTYTAWKDAGRPDDIVQRSSPLKQGSFSAVPKKNQEGYFALLVHGSPEVSVKVELLSSKSNCPLRLKFASRNWNASSSVGSVSRILNGLDLSTNGSYGYNVALDSELGFCSGSLIAPQWVLTAAHCHVKKGNFLWVGHHKHWAAATFTHPSFSKSKTSIFHDLALIKITEPVRDAHLRTIDVHGAPEQNIAGQYARATGYGRNTRRGKLDQHLRAADLFVLSIDQCRRRFRALGLVNVPKSIDPASQLCTDGSECGTSACIGDSGGALVAVGRNGTPVQVGVMSSLVNGCTTLPDLYTKVAAHADWIQRTTRGGVRPVRL